MQFDFRTAAGENRTQGSTTLYHCVKNNQFETTQTREYRPQNLCANTPTHFVHTPGKNGTTPAGRKEKRQRQRRRASERLTKVQGAVHGEVGADVVHVVAVDERRVVQVVEGRAGLGGVVVRVADIGALVAGLHLVVAADGPKFSATAYVPYGLSVHLRGAWGVDCQAENGRRFNVARQPGSQAGRSRGRGYKKKKYSIPRNGRSIPILMAFCK